AQQGDTDGILDLPDRPGERAPERDEQQQRQAREQNIRAALGLLRHDLRARALEPLPRHDAVLQREHRQQHRVDRELLDQRRGRGHMDVVHRIDEPDRVQERAEEHEVGGDPVDEDQCSFHRSLLPETCVGGCRWSDCRTNCRPARRLIMSAAMIASWVISVLLAALAGQDPPARSPEDLFRRPVELQQQGKWEEAVAAWREYLARAPRHGEAHANLGAALARLGKYEEAIASYQTALQLNPRLTPVYYNVGLLHYRA